MSHQFKTTDPEMQWAVDEANSLMERTYRHRLKRFRETPAPDFSQLRWYLGEKQRRALAYFMGHVGAIHGAGVMGIPVIWVREDTHAALVEVKG